LGKALIVLRFPFCCADLSAFKWIRVDLGGFGRISWIPGVGGLSTCGGLKSRAATPKERLQTPILQVWRLGGLDAWRLEAQILHP